MVLDEWTNPALADHCSNLLIDVPLSPRKTPISAALWLMNDGAICVSCVRIVVMGKSRIDFTLVSTKSVTFNR